MKEVWNKLKIEEGEKFGRLTVIEEVEKAPSTRMFKCKCECGTIGTYRLVHLRSGATKSCGCLKKDNAGKQRITHGLTRTRLYRIWNNILTRCNNSNRTTYQYYGGKGIKCERDSFEEFKKDMGESHDKHVKKYGERQTTIDRINNDGNYCKENCRWATQKEQANNMTSNILIEYKNKKLTLKQRAVVLGIKYTTLYTRLHRGGLSIEDAFTRPNRYKR